MYFTKTNKLNESKDSTGALRRNSLSVNIVLLNLCENSHRHLSAVRKQNVKCIPVWTVLNTKRTKHLIHVSLIRGHHSILFSVYHHWLPRHKKQGESLLTLNTLLQFSSTVNSRCVTSFSCEFLHKTDKLSFSLIFNQQTSYWNLLMRKFGFHKPDLLWGTNGNTFLLSVTMSKNI